MKQATYQSKIKKNILLITSVTGKIFFSNTKLFNKKTEFVKMIRIVIYFILKKDFCIFYINRIKFLSRKPQISFKI